MQTSFVREVPRERRQANKAKKEAPPPSRATHGGGDTPLHPRSGMRLDPSDPLARAMLSAGGALGIYHRHRALRLERLGRALQRGRPIILVGNHVLDVVDPLLFVKEVYARFGVVPRAMGHQAWFKTPLLRDVCERYKVVPSREPDAARRALREDGLLMLFPGAVREAALRDFAAEPYRLKWEGRSGFLRLALEADADILFFAAVGTEEMYYQSKLRVPDGVLRLVQGGDASRYHGLRLTFGLTGPHLVPGVFPFPAKVTHVVSEPLALGDRAHALRDEAAFAALHRRVTAECQDFLDSAVAAFGREAGLMERGVRAGHALLRRVGL
jgi:1-acyl-sn-glycerol-3-phosphate acyltransferase